MTLCVNLSIQKKSCGLETLRFQSKPPSEFIECKKQTKTVFGVLQVNINRTIYVIHRLWGLWRLFLSTILLIPLLSWSMSRLLQVPLSNVRLISICSLIRRLLGLQSHLSLGFRTLQATSLHQWQSTNFVLKPYTRIHLSRYYLYT